MRMVGDWAEIYVHNDEVGTSISIPYSSASAMTVGSAATGIYWKTARQMLAPFTSQEYDYYRPIIGAGVSLVRVSCASGFLQDQQSLFQK